MDAGPQVLFEDNHLLVLNKPAPLATMGVTPDQASLITWARAYIKKRYHKPGNVYLGVVSRLDAVATGVIVVARTSKAAARLTQQFRESQVQKIYWALVAPPPANSQGEWIDYLRKDERQQRMTMAHRSDTDAQQARLQYTTKVGHPRVALIEVQLLTGRKHQIRVQFSSRGSPIVGDRKYGSREPFPRGIALHSYRLTLLHPTRQQQMEFVAPPPAYWNQFAARLGFKLYQ